MPFCKVPKCCPRVAMEPHPRFINLCPMILVHQYVLRNSYRPRPLIHVALTTVYEVTILIQRNLPLRLIPEIYPDCPAIWPWSQSLHNCHLISPQGSLMRQRSPLVRKTRESRSLTSILLLQSIFHDIKRGEKCTSPIPSVSSFYNSLRIRPEAATNVTMGPLLRDFSE